MTATIGRHRRRMRTRTIGWAILTALVLAALATPFLWPGAALAAAQSPCQAIVHRGLHGPQTDEETTAAVTGSARFGFGAELDARVTADGGLVAVHDDTLTRVTAGADTRRPEELTMDELRAVTLEHGGHPASIRRLVRAAKASGGSLLIEGKRWPQHTDAWRDSGLARLAAAITDLGMTDRVWVGGTLGFTRAVHDFAPTLRTFWRADADEPLDPAHAQQRWATLVEAPANMWNAAKANLMLENGIAPATRNADGAAEWQAAYDAGVLLMQTNRPHALAEWCAAR